MRFENKTNMKYITLVLSPEKFVERREHMSQMLNQSSIKFEFVAIDDDTVLTPESIEQIHDKQRTIDSFGRDLTRGELASTLNHLLAYRKFLDSEVELALILEDDANFDTSHFGHMVDIIAKEIDTEDPQVYLLTPVTSYLNHNAKPLCDDFKIVKVVCAWGAGYFINRAAAEKILDINDKSWIICDDWVKYNKYGNINIMAVVPPIVRPNPALESNLLVDYQNAAKQKVFKQRTFKYTVSRNKDKLLADLKKYLWLIPFRGFVRNKKN